MIDFVDGFVAPGLGCLADWSLRWGLLLAALALWLALRPPRRAATRHLLCVVALAAGVLLPVSPRWRADLPLRPRRPALAASPRPAEVPTDRGRPFAAPPIVPIAADVPVSRATTPLARETSVPPSRPSPGAGRVALLAVAATWAGVVAVLLARLLAGQVFLRRLRRAAVAVGGDSVGILNDSRAALNLSRRVSLATHPAVGSPVALGGLRPVVLVPPGWDRWPEADRRACLLHELAHLAGGDDWAKLAQELVRVPLFFHPLVRWLLARLDRERELLRDEAVVALGADPVAYARLLLDLARRPGRLLPSAPAAAASYRHGWLPFLDRRTVAARIERLLEDDMSRTLTSPTPRRLFALATLALAAALGVGGLTVRAVEPRAETKADDTPAPPPSTPTEAGPERPRSRTIRGRVLEPDGSPAPAAVVVAGFLQTGMPAQYILTTDDEGRFSWTIPPGAVEPSLYAHAPGWAIAERSFDPEGEVTDVDLKLDRPGPFAAVLVDGRSNPIVGAEVRVGSSAHSRESRQEGGGSTFETVYHNYRRDVLDGSPLEPLLATTTDERGAFILDSFGPDPWLRLAVTTRDGRKMHVRMSARSGDFLNKMMREEGFVASTPGQDARLVAYPTARVEGRVTTKLPGVGVSGLRVWYQGTRVVRPGRVANSTGETRTDAEGRFTFDDLDEGPINIFVVKEASDAPWISRPAGDVRLESGRTTGATIELLRGVEVEGKVIAQDTGRAINGAWVGIHGPGHPISGAAAGSARTDAQGRFRDRLPPGETHFYVAGPVDGYVTQPTRWSSRTVVIPDGRDTFEIPTIALLPAIRVDGRILDGSGRPVAGARVVGVCDRDGCILLDQEPVEADARGRFHLSVRPGFRIPLKKASGFQVALPDGRQFEVAAAPPESGELILKLAAFRGEEGRAEGPMIVAPDEVAGKVVGDDGKPLAGVQVDAYFWVPKHPATTTDGDGVFRLSKMPREQEVNLRIRKNGYETQYHDRPTGEAGWVAVLGNATYFEGRVLAPDGNAVPDAPIRADAGPTRRKGFMMGETLTEASGGPDGRYRLHVLPGQYDISVRVPGTGVARLSKEAIAAGQHQALDIRLMPGVDFAARCVDRETGLPVEGVRLWAWLRPGIEGTSDADGRIRIRDVPPGTYPRLQVEPEGKAAGYSRWWSAACLNEWSRFQKSARFGFQRNFDALDFDIQPGMAPVTIQLERGATVRGRVVDPDGRPVAAATVAPALTGSGNSLTGDTRFSVETGEDGRFEVLLPASGDIAYNLIAHDGKPHVGPRLQWRNWANGVTPTFKTTPGQSIDDLEIRLNRPGTITGRVSDAAGDPVAGCEVRAEPTAKDENRYYDPTARTGPDGTFTLKFVRPGENFIQAAPFFLRADQAPEGTSRTVTVESGRTVSGVDLKAAPRR